MNGKFTTYSGIEFSPEFLQIENVDIKDIAHALSRICRFNGHIKEFYSVAQHCIQVSNTLKDLGCNKKIQLCGLLHDAAEAYLGDLPTPIKKTLNDYVLLETQYRNTIFKRFNLFNSWNKLHLEIKDIDDEVLNKEWEFLNGDCKNNAFFDFNKIEEDYLNLYFLLCT